MRKSPLSAPGGSNGKRNYDTNNSPSPRRHGYNGTSYYDQYRRGDATNDCLDSLSESDKQKSSNHKNADGFIPLGYSSPMNQHQYQHQYQNQNQNQNHWRANGGWHGRRGASTTNNAGYNNHRNNSYNKTPNSSFNDSNSPSYFKKQNFANRRHRQKDAHRQVDIGSYVNARTMLEDPWADLMRNFEYQNSKNRSNHSEKILSAENFVKESGGGNLETGIDGAGEIIDGANRSGEILDREIGSDDS